MPISWQVTKYLGSVEFRKINRKCETRGLVTPCKRDWSPHKQEEEGSILGVLAVNQGSCTSLSTWGLYSLESILYKCCSSLPLKSHFRVKVKSWPPCRCEVKPKRTKGRREANTTSATAVGSWHSTVGFSYQVFVCISALFPKMSGFLIFSDTKIIPANGVQTSNQ